MNKNLLWRGVLIIVVVGLMGFSVYPPGERIKLGLDLRGGMYLVLRVQVEDALRSDRDKVIDRLVLEAADVDLGGVAPRVLGDTSFELSGVPADRDAAVRKIVDDFLPQWRWHREGSRLVFQLNDGERRRLEDLAVRQALQTIRNRVDAFGVADPVIQRHGFSGERLVIQLPGVDDPERVKRLIKNTAFLEFRLVDYPDGGRSAGSREEILNHYGGVLPERLEILTETTWDDAGTPTGSRYYAVEKRSVITGRDLKSASPSQGRFNEPIVQFNLTHEGGRMFGEATGANVGKGLAIVLDGQVRSAPRLKSRITDSGVIEGQFTQQEVEDLATLLQSGALPAGITYLEERTVGPSLGQDSIEQGFSAGLIGGALVLLAMVVVYKLTSLNAILALTLNVILVFGALAYFGATLTLPGIAGIVLTVGMAVDANVLVFERIREELRSGRTVKSAVDNGFGKALSSILDANFTTLLAAMFLYNFGTGPIRGFAVTLSVGILASLFTAVFVSRWVFDLNLSRRGRVERLSI